MVVEPISKEFNDEYLTGKGLDTNFFNPTDVMQYYQVSNYGGLTADQIFARLHDFSIASYPPRKLTHIQQLTILFYKQKLFVDYRDHLYESARDNDTRRLSDYHDDLLASISFERLKDDPRKMSLQKILYNKGKFQKEMNDTISAP
ncbi:hypothetical protein ACFQ3S_09015 [Mucilaginibacter terrae]|uniref:hypothetical protein n=1 Tax=Mucilaginibacter terrae TaxID=1955052 RepID=UPI0036455272